MIWSGKEEGFCFVFSFVKGLLTILFHWKSHQLSLKESGLNGSKSQEKTVGIWDARIRDWRIKVWSRKDCSTYVKEGQSDSRIKQGYGIKIAKRNINNLRYANATTLMAESEEELKSLLMKVKEESENVVLKLNIQKTRIMASGPHRWGNKGNRERLYFLGLQKHCRWYLQPWN